MDLEREQAQCKKCDYRAISTFIEFYRAHELTMERFRQKGPDDGYLGLNMIRGIKFKSVRSPVDRTIVIDPFAGDVGTTEAEQMDFFRSISAPRFLQIRKAVGDKHIDDAFHFWTAEEAKLDTFLTMDQKFWRVLNQNKHLIQSKATVMTPKELCERLSVHPIDIEEMASIFPPFA